MNTLNCHGRLIDLSVPKVMGIINATPDSFYDGGTTVTKRTVLLQAEKMLSEGATILDIGGYSSRPGATNISASEEKRRVTKTVSAIQQAFPEAIISVDTFRSSVARAAVEEGAHIINDISAGKLDSDMFATVAKLKTPYIMMHMKGTPQNMVQKATYKNVTIEVVSYFSERIYQARLHGITDLLIDPGFGFAKNQAHNFELLNNLEFLSTLDTPILVGLSRKSMIYKTLNTTAENALNGTTALHSVALLKRAAILRVHDVAEAMQCISLFQNLNPIAWPN